ncbi:ABC transporter ATP-binding protein [Denitrobaculum tricleocarpae]|nr:ABC transporter ATP-binding protein [Denitrobaculum tricleocarpae]
MSETPGGLELQNLTMNFGSVRAIDGIDLTLPEGKFVCLLGPSGCGKTTLLRLIAGLQNPSSGDIVFNGKSMTGVPSHKRDFGMVFQSLALFPHLNIAQNIAYSLRIRGQSAVEMKTRVEELLEMVHLPGVGDRRITQLSGGQRQRVAIARALAIHPRLFLLDEPLSALDAKLREAMQVELRQLQKSLGITTIVVTHDQREAMTMADHVVIMKDGKVQQYGPPLEIYRKPATAFVADFIGASNLMPCAVTDSAAVELYGRKIVTPDLSDTLRPGQGAMLSVRPEDIHILPGVERETNSLSATVTFIRDLGAQVEIMLEHGEQHLIATMTPKDKPDVAVGDVVCVEIPTEACRVFPA